MKLIKLKILQGKEEEDRRRQKKTEEEEGRSRKIKNGAKMKKIRWISE
jgi:hypothetical protein